MANPPSRFLLEIPPHLVQWRRGEPDQTWSGFTRSDFSSVSSQYFGSMPAPSRPPKQSPARGRHPQPNLRHEQFAVGDRVNHDKYGLGKVVGCHGQGQQATVTVDFGGGKTMKLMLLGGVPMSKL
jgi:DNA helicase-2/ATP-dependent DNA helicase PcrA